MHSLHTSFHLLVGVGVTSVSEQPEMLYNIARHDCSYMYTVNMHNKNVL